MKEQSLLEQFKQLLSKKDSDKHFVVVVDNTEHRLGVSSDGFPQFYIRVNQSPVSIPTVLRELLLVEYNRNCTIIEEEETITQGYFAILTLQTTDPYLQEYFIDIFSMMLHRLPQFPTNQQIAVEVEKLISIFSAMKQKPKKMIQGLWSELLVIERSSNPEILATAWHSDPLAKYDFTMGQDKIEVKSTSSDERKHVFSLDQLNPSKSSHLLVASLIVRESAECENGLSVANMYDRICNRGISIDAKVHISTVMAEVAGNNFRQLDKVFFDYSQAADTLAFYESENIPRINKEYIPAGVSEVKFTSNLEGVESIETSATYNWGEDSELFNAL